MVLSAKLSSTSKPGLARGVSRLGERVREIFRIILFVARLEGLLGPPTGRVVYVLLTIKRGIGRRKQLATNNWDTSAVKDLAGNTLKEEKRGHRRFGFGAMLGTLSVVLCTLYYNQACSQ